jgi:hypothetical protein
MMHMRQRYLPPHLPAKNAPILSLRNLPSSGLGAAPAVCPHNDGIGLKTTVVINPFSYSASPIGK